MEIPKNKFKAALQGDKRLFGIFLGIPNTSIAELCAGAGFDWLIIDGEHSPFDLQSIMAHLQAMAPYPVSAIVRPVEGQAAIIKQMLDIGAQSLLIPMVDTAEQAEQMVKACKYPPQGIRGLGTAMARAAQWNRIPDYLHKANDEVCLIVQIETVTALENVDVISAVDGVDAVFIGPSDLSASMGYVGQQDHPEVVKAVCQAIASIKAAGKAAGVLAVKKELIDKYTEAGAKFIGVGVDTAIFSNATKKLAAEYVEDVDGADIAGY
ncbi:2-keto-3-deoxy-L-rhamnonate aldolase [Haliea sp. AH-315-K21]|uniref:2-keto-3-deoxy-L-rhamnonate aldolase n=1 Tax=SAR86 cluster bacterium TaxID=2030880 RepID=A0A2A5C7P8_9GAMM|nr:2-keto-3-deoxy-L-rhamnonate aldolase [Haliea sp. AH-315-K21]PCJ39406.1 MAG: 2-keto-3-deoxy-L-rhamnonate aldolase [SAR86 cluster bacterium]